MKNLNTELTLVSRTGSEAALVAIDLESKTCIIRNGKTKTVTFTTAASYKTNFNTKKGPRPLSEKVLKEILDADQIPTGATFETTVPVPDDNSLQYIEDLASSLDMQAKSLRKKLRQLEAAGLIKKTNHTWCWEPNQFNAILSYLQKVQEAK